jgi:hypothetical protein
MTVTEYILVIVAQQKHQHQALVNFYPQCPGAELRRSSRNTEQQFRVAK